MPDVTGESSPDDLERFDIERAFTAREAELSARLSIGKSLTDHPTMVGTGTEHGWSGLLRAFLPGRYGVVSGKVVDSEGYQSQQIDVIVHDTFYSPMMFTVGDSTFVPAESVYGVFEVKQTLNKAHLTAAADKAESVRRLHRTSALIPNQFGQAITKNLDGFSILAGILTSECAWTAPIRDNLHRNLAEQTGDRAIDIGCALGVASFDVLREAPQSGRGLCDLMISATGRSLSFFAVRLLHRLQQMGTVGAIDYMAYAESALSARQDSAQSSN